MVFFKSRPPISRSCSSSSWPKVHSLKRPFFMSWYSRQPGSACSVPRNSRWGCTALTSAAVASAFSCHSSAPPQPRIALKLYSMPASVRRRSCSFASSAVWPLFMVLSAASRPLSTPMSSPPMPHACRRRRSSSVLCRMFWMEAYMAMVFTRGSFAWIASAIWIKRSAESTKASPCSRNTRSTSGQ